MQIRRSFAALALLVAASAVPTAAHATAPHSLDGPAAVALSHPGTDSAPTVRAVVTHAVLTSIDSLSASVRVPTSPARQRVPFEAMALGGVIGATKRTTRRVAGKKRDAPMYLDSEVHVMRENANGSMVTTTIRGGQLVDDTDLTDDEIDELTALRVIRPATSAELDRLDRVDAETARNELVATQAAELSQLRANTEVARSALVAKGAKAEDLVAFDGKASEDVAALQTKHAAALAKLAE